LQLKSSMRRDSIFYKLFQQSPTLLFELLTNPPANAGEYLRGRRNSLKRFIFSRLGIVGLFPPSCTSLPVAIARLWGR
jgi:Protein of unknown function (DUF2887)